MGDGRFLDAVYCDDIRHEVGNKLTLVGCYGPDLSVQQPLPVTLPKLCVYVRVFSPVDHPFGSLKVRVCQGDVVLAEASMPLQRNSETDLAESRWQVVIAAMSLSPFFVEKETKLRIEAETENGVLRGPALRICTAHPVTTEADIGPPPRGKAGRRKGTH